MTSSVTGMIPLPQYGEQDWKKSNQRQYSNSQALCNIAESTVQQGELLRETSQEDAQRKRLETEREWKRRLTEMEFWSGEIDRFFDKLDDIIDKLCNAKRRLERGLEMVSRFLEAAQTCLIWRSKRFQVDDVSDLPHRLLVKGISLCGVNSKLLQLHGKIIEQVRLSKSRIIKLREVLTQKNAARDADQIALNFGLPEESSPNLGPICPVTQSVSYETWRQNTNNHCIQTWKLIQDGYEILQDFDKTVDASELKAVHRDLIKALEERVNETKDAKERLEQHLKETLRQIEDVEENGRKLEDAYRERTCRLTLVQSRMHARRCRPEAELSRDCVEIQMERESNELTQQLQQLALHIDKNRNLLRNLRHVASQLESDIDAKAFSLNVDQVQCYGLLSSVIPTDF